MCSFSGIYLARFLACLLIQKGGLLQLKFDDIRRR